jgi:hypothetical protein
MEVKTLKEKELVINLVELARDAARHGSSGKLYQFDYEFSKLLKEHKYGYYDPDDPVFEIHERFNKTDT